MFNLHALLREDRAEQEMDDEIRFHIDKQIEQNIAEGMSIDEAHFAALRAFGNVGAIEEECRDSWHVRFMNELFQDFRYGLRQLRRSPGFTAVAINTLALGIGANTAIFSVVNGVLLNPLPYPQPERLVALYSRTEQFSRASISYPNFLDWERDNRSFSSLAAYRSDHFSLTGKGEPESVPADMVSATFFPVLGVNPVIGRNFTPQENQIGAPPVALISGGFWKRKFGSSPDVLGKALTLNGRNYTIVGVIPSSFYFESGVSNFQIADVYVPIGQWSDPNFRDRRVSMGMDAVGRLKPGVTFEQARVHMDALAQHLAEQYPDADKGSGIAMVSLKQDMVGSMRLYLLVLLAAVGFVLLIACVNVANLMLARSSSRAREFAIRIALGAGRRRVIRQLLTESTLLALAGGGLGILLATWGLQAALKMLPEALPRVQEVHLDGRVLLFTLVVSVLTGILFGLAPALKTSAADIQATLKEGGRGASAGHHRTQSVFVVAQMALALVLLAGAGLLVRSLVKLWSVDPGFDPHHVLIAYASFPPAKNAEATLQSWQDIQGRLASLPGVRAASLSVAARPLQGDSELPFWLEGQPKPASESQMKQALFYVVQPDYLKVMGIPLLRGRFLTSADNQHAPFVTVIDQDFARLYFPNQNPIGKRINIDILNTTAEIVGVAGHVKQWGLDESSSSPVLAQCYMAAAQTPEPFVPLIAANIAAVVRTQGSPVAEIGAIRRTIEQINSRAVVAGTPTMESIVSDSLSAQRFSMALMGVFAALALLMASLGIYAVVSYVTSQRTHEIGIRMALGAQRNDVLRLVVGQGLKLALAGVAIGIIGALGLTRFLASLLYGIKPTDPLTFVAVSLILTAVGVLGCFIPACRAARIDPNVALRYE
ncbi:MAG TPA: ABC transporter permease [Terriglobia bacterium]|nr:ABC transporter permease [Terriglobia bacterium]